MPRKKTVALTDGDQTFSIEKLNGSEYFINKKMHNMTRKDVDVTADFWFYSIVRIDGSLNYRKKDKFLNFESGTYLIVYPPWSLTEIGGTFVQCEVKIFISKDNKLIDRDLPGILHLEDDCFDSSFTELKKKLDDSCLQNISINDQPTYLAAEIKSKIDNSFNTNIKLSKIAKQLGVSVSHLSVTFKRNFGVSPSYYIHQLRVVSSIFELLDSKEENKKIIDVAYGLGYDDISRFNKQFKKRTTVNPGKLV